MEAETEQNDNATSQNDTSWSSTTNWIIADGSLVNSITFESSLSPTIDGDDDNQNSDENQTYKSPLVLYPPSPDQTPCEITINFARKHEVQQVYVRSTARVYEIYYASNLQSSNEYLCTVRCGVATRDEEVLHTPDIGEVTLTNQEGDGKESDEKRTKGESSSSTNEDGWVEVKDFDSPRFDNGKFSCRQILDFYEATAQITDADPCMSITVRLLSLQNKGCVFVDEIYVFGDPVEPADSENAIASQIEMPSRLSDGESKPDLSSSHDGKVLDHLVFRVSRIEDLLLRFEERMLKPLNSIEARLQHVEQQIEELNKKPQNSKLRCCTRFSAPEFSCHELDDFLDNNENNMPSLAPEISHAADEEEDDELEAVADSSKEEPKRFLILSVDDALASALAGLLSSTSAEPQKYTQALAIKAPDFSSEEDSNSGKKASREIKDGIATDPPIHYTVTDETEYINDSVSTSSNIHFSESELEEKMIHRPGVSRMQLLQLGKEITEIDLHQITEDIEGLEVINRLSNTSVLDDCEAVNQFLDNQMDDGSDSTQDVAFVNSEFTTTTEVKDEESDKAILQNILEFPCASSIVDFKIPILDVKFVSQDISHTRSLLEAFLADIPDSNDEARATEKDNGSQVGEQCNLISWMIMNRQFQQALTVSLWMWTTAV
ncbi:hypothetical protein Pint_23989 [Pistacia integerrima]|uniref:Uncharacterized protein n=1 Tax=Pistacia integerrima TaxID=434235 RepID=A0ACC0YMM4_9ROSI|nr:hypothetical protein Pint_23989 [Pistacia integerrima]